MNIDIEKMLFEIPENVEFPMELCHHLRTKLSSVMGHNCLLKRHIAYLDKEVIELRKSKLEQQSHHHHHDTTRTAPTDSDQPSLMASKIVELSKKNREMTAHLESMKTKLKKVMFENEQLRSSANLSMESQEKEVEDKAMSESPALTSVEGDLLSSASQLSQTTAKMMEYRRQCQQLRLELKTALRALAQEVGESATPQSVLCTVNAPTWRGRQQQIMTLHQKLTDIQMKLVTKMEGCQGAGDGPEMHSDNISVSEVSVSHSHRSGISNSSFSTLNHRTGLMQQDVKKHEQIRKLTSDMNQTSEDLKSRQKELKASKARIQTLESQSKSYRNQMDLLEAKLQEKDHETKNIWDEMSHLKQELMTVKDREKRNRDQSSLEIQEASRALTRERAIIGRLQQVINEKQEAIQKADIEMIELRNKLELCCSSKVAGGMHAVERLQELELQLRRQSQLLASSEKEQQRLIDLVDNAASDADHEHHKVVQAQRESAQIYVVLQQANKCIDQCLETANVTDSNLLQEVENIRTMIRELNAGELYSLNKDATGVTSMKKLRTKVDLLNKELAIVQANFKELTETHKKETSRHARVYEQLKQELIVTLSPPNKKWVQ